MLSKFFRGGEVVVPNNKGKFFIFKNESYNGTTTKYVLYVEKTNLETKYTLFQSLNDDEKENYQYYGETVVKFDDIILDNNENAQDSLFSITATNILYFVSDEKKHQFYSDKSIFYGIEWKEANRGKLSICQFERKRDYFRSFFVV